MEWTRDGRKGHGTYEDGNIFIQTVRKLLKKNHLFSGCCYIQHISLREDKWLP